jgi:hypothetical protein
MSAKSTSVAEQLRSINSALAATASSISLANNPITATGNGDGNGKEKVTKDKNDGARDKEDEEEEALLFQQIEDGMTAMGTKPKIRVALAPEKARQIVILKQEEITKQQHALNRKLFRMMNTSSAMITGTQKYMQEQQARNTALIQEQEAYMKQLQAENNKVTAELREERRIARERDEETAKQKWASGTMGVVSALVTVAVVAPLAPAGISGGVLVISAGSGAGGLGLYIGNAFYKPIYSCFVSICNLFKSDCCKSSCCGGCSSCCEPDSNSVVALKSVAVQPDNLKAGSNSAVALPAPDQSLPVSALPIATSAVVFSPAAAVSDTRPALIAAESHPLTINTASASVPIVPPLPGVNATPAPSSVAAVPPPLVATAASTNSNGTSPITSPSSNILGNGNGSIDGSTNALLMPNSPSLGVGALVRPATPNSTATPETPATGRAQAYMLPTRSDIRPISATVISTPPSPILMTANARNATRGRLSSTASLRPAVAPLTPGATSTISTPKTAGGATPSRRQTGTISLSSGSLKRSQTPKAVVTRPT